MLIRQSLFPLLILLGGCGSGPRPDEDIETDVAFKVHSVAPDITISVNSGVLYLSGIVSDSASWRATIDSARSVDGVNEIDDKLHIAR